MHLEGGCYCGALRYVVDGQPQLVAQCHCRECQYISGGGPNFVAILPEASFRYTKGAPRQFRRSDLAQPVTRDFCADCGTHLLTRPPGAARVGLKLGTLDQPGAFGMPQLAAFAVDMQPFHLIPEGIPVFERSPR